VIVAAREPDDAEAAGESANDIKGLASNRARRAEDGDAGGLIHRLQV
jgi:hypothetical protein